MIKKMIVLLLALALVGNYAISNLNSVYAETQDIVASEKQLEEGSMFTLGELDYWVLSNNTVQVYTCEEFASEVTIPEYAEYNGIKYHVTGIGEYAFSNCQKITTIIIPDSVTSIDKGAFNNCRSLTNITIPNGVKIISEEMFKDCVSLSNVIIPQGVTSIYMWAFSGCEKLESIIIPENVISIGQDAFTACSNLKEVTISSGVKRIENRAFSDCTNLMSIKIPSSVTSIGRSVFLHCDKITLYVEANSYALQYAKDNEYPYKLYTSDGSTYPDVKKSAWYYYVVETATTRNLMGIEDKESGSFSPDKNISRGMVATVLYRMAGTPKVTFTAKFPDVKENIWYSNAIIWANQTGIVKGYNNGKFGPDDKITRQDLAIMLRNYAVNVGKLEASEKADLSNFKDVKAISDYALPSLEWVVANKIISGKEEGTKVAPIDNATRAECAKMFVMLQDLVNKK